MSRGRRPLFDKRMTDAEKQRRYRIKKKAELESAIDSVGLRQKIRQELIVSWEPEAKKEYLAAERKKAREKIKNADQNYFNGRVSGICSVACFFVGKKRLDIAQQLMSYFMITEESATEALQADKRTKNIDLEYLKKAGAWLQAPPPDETGEI